MSLFALAAGGTAGHINPALALAQELTGRGHEVHFYGTKKGMEATLIPQEGFAFEALDLSGFDRSRPWTALSALYKMRRARKEILDEFARSATPDVIVGFGAYVCFPLADAASKIGVPLALHEQNSVPGIANKLLAKKADILALTYPCSREAFAGRLGPSTRVEVCGNPVRRSVLQASRTQGRAALGIPQDAKVLLVFGGSLGAAHLNAAVLTLRDELLKRKNLYIVHASGKGGYEEYARKLNLDEEEQKRWKLMSYIDDMGSCLAAADLVLSRAGASSVAEIAARAVPAVLVPYPYARQDHQTMNASLLCDIDAAVLVPDAALDDPSFAHDFVELLDDDARLAQMASKAATLGYSGAAARLADAVESLIASAKM